jgi:AAA+ superfamily predicted ATPase
VLDLAALEHRRRTGPMTDRLAGLRIDDREIDHLLAGSDGSAAAADSGDIDPAAASLASARQRLVDSLSADNPFATIVGNAELDQEEAELLAVVVAAEMSLRRQRLLAYLQDDVTKPQLVLQTIPLLFGSSVFAGTHPGVSVIGHQSGLRRAALVDVIEDGPWGQHRVVVAPSVIWALSGEIGSDPKLPYGAGVVEVDDVGRHDFLIVSGRDRLRRRQLAASVGRGTRFVVSPAPDSEAGWNALVREATLIGAGLIIETDEPLPVEARRMVDRATHLTWVLSGRSAPDLGDLPNRPRVELEAEAAPPDADEWEAVFGTGQARTHAIQPEQLEPLGRAFDARGRDLDAAVRRLVGRRLEQLARRIRPTLGWEDLVLSPDRMAQLRQIADTFRSAGKVYDEWGFAPGSTHGLVALFSGPSGAGKTLSAEVLARELHLDVFKLEMSAVVSKYIGETEKNLEEVFDAASAGNLVLFFDEADALFGKRSEVKDARDRYANIEVSYLLQRLERYEGVVILATNFEKNLDEAFLRRIHTRIDFVLPGEVERLAIWQLNLPAAAPVAADVDLSELAQRFHLSGASIRGAAVHAAFLASLAGTSITMDHLVMGVARDFRKFGRLIKPDEFGDFYSLVASAPQ